MKLLMKIKIIAMIWFVFSVAATCVLLLFSYLMRDACVDTVIQRIASPNNKVEAVVVETNCGTLCSGSYNVYLVPFGVNSFSGKNHVLKASVYQWYDYKWVDDEHFAVEYSRADIDNLSSPWRYNGIQYNVYVQLMHATD
jgi:hypothetical protein